MRISFAAVLHFGIAIGLLMAVPSPLSWAAPQPSGAVGVELDQAEVERRLAAFIAAARKADPETFWKTQDLGWIVGRPVAIERLVGIYLADPTLNNYPWPLLYFLPAERWPQIVARAYEAYRHNPQHNSAGSILAWAVDASPEIVAPYLGRFFEAGDGPWRGAFYHPEYRGGNRHLVDLLYGQAIDSRSPRQLEAIQALMETGNLEGVTRLLTRNPQVSGAEGLALHFGFERVGAQVRRLYPERVYQVLPDGDDDPRLQSAGYGLPPVPTPQALPKVGTGRLGGLSAEKCGVCRRPLHRLLALDAVPLELGVTGLPRLELAACLSCLGWERDVMYFHHDAQGRPTYYGSDGDKVVDGRPRAPLAETRVTLTDWGKPHNAQLTSRFRLGGEPSWYQHPMYLACPKCHRRSTMLLQMPDGMKTEDDNTWYWGSGGYCYVLWCDDCKISTCSWQDS